MNKDQAFWDKASKNYDKSEQRFEYIHSLTREKAKKYLRRNNIILDYGCGTGTASCEFSPLVKTVDAIDISSEMIEIAKDKAVTHQVNNINFLQTTIFDDNYEDESFDVIVAFNMLHTIDDPKKVIDRIHHLLKPNGLFISSTPCLKGKKSLLITLQIFLVKILEKLKIIPISIRKYKSFHIDELIAIENFDVVEAEELYKDASSYFVVARKVGDTIKD